MLRFYHGEGGACKREPARLWSRQALCTTFMLKTNSAPRTRGGRRTLTLDLRDKDFERLIELASEKDLPASTMARMLLVSGLASGEGVE